MSSPLDHQENMASPEASTALDQPTVSIACSTCRRLVPAGAPCPHCTDQPEPLDPTPADATVVLPPVRDRTVELDLMALQAPAADPETTWAQPDTRRRTLAVLAAAAALVVVAAAAIAGLRAGSGGGERAASASRASASSDAVPVDPATIRVTASSTQRPDGGVTYAASNTLDGRPETAWNSDGQGAGAVLTYTFPRAVDVTSLTVRNGYQKVRPGKGGAPVDLFLLNERVRTFRVVTDAGSVAWTLQDDRAPQTLDRDLGRTRTVRLEVVAVYPSQKYRDLAVSDVSFRAAS